ncbi:MAG: hypothetical protein WBC92_05210 [Terracidiphilus sp.]
MPPIPAVPGFQFELERYAGKVKVLGILWLAYAVLSFSLGMAALAFASSFMSGGFGPWANGPWMHGPWANGPMPPAWLGSAWLHFAWLLLSIRAILCGIAGWGLLERTQWGRIIAIVAAILCLIKFPFGMALGIATLIILLGYRNSALYEQL